jgi:hypothetical protein
MKVLVTERDLEKEASKGLAVIDFYAECVVSSHKRWRHGPGAGKGAEVCAAGAGLASVQRRTLPAWQSSTRP